MGGYPDFAINLFTKFKTSACLSVNGFFIGEQMLTYTILKKAVGCQGGKIEYIRPASLYIDIERGLIHFLLPCFASGMGMGAVYWCGSSFQMFSSSVKSVIWVTSLSAKGTGSLWRGFFNRKSKPSFGMGLVLPPDR